MTIGRLDAFALRGEVIDTYRDYVQGFIKIADQRVADEVDTALGSGNLWPEPWVQDDLTREHAGCTPFRWSGESLQALPVGDGPSLSASSRRRLRPTEERREARP